MKLSTSWKLELSNVSLLLSEIFLKVFLSFIRKTIKGCYIACVKTSVHLWIIWLKENLTERLYKTIYRSFRHLGWLLKPMSKDIIYVKTYKRQYKTDLGISASNYGNGNKTAGGQLRKLKLNPLPNVFGVVLKSLSI